MTDGRFTIGLVASEEMSALRRATDTIAASALIQRRDDTHSDRGRCAASHELRRIGRILRTLRSADGSRSWVYRRRLRGAGPQPRRLVAARLAHDVRRESCRCRHDDSVCRRERARRRGRTGQLRHPARGRPLVRAAQPRFDRPRLRRVRALQAGGEPGRRSPGSWSRCGPTWQRSIPTRRRIASS